MLSNQSVSNRIIVNALYFGDMAQRRINLPGFFHEGFARPVLDELVQLRQEQGKPYLGLIAQRARDARRLISPLTATVDYAVGTGRTRGVGPASFAGLSHLNSATHHAQRFAYLQQRAAAFHFGDMGVLGAVNMVDYCARSAVLGTVGALLGATAGGAAWLVMRPFKRPSQGLVAASGDAAVWGGMVGCGLAMFTMVTDSLLLSTLKARILGAAPKVAGIYAGMLVGCAEVGVRAMCKAVAKRRHRPMPLPPTDVATVSI